MYSRLYTQSTALAGYTFDLMGTADEIADNRAKRQTVSDAGSALDAEMFRLVKQGYNEGIPVPELARLARVTRGRIYQILKDE